MDCSTPGLPVLHHLSRSLPKFMSIVSVMPSSYLILWCPLLLLPSLLPSIGEFSNGSAVRIRWPKYWSFSFSISPSNKYSGLISLKIEWFDLLAVQGNFQGSSPAPQFEGMDSLAFCFLAYPALTAICDPREDHSLDYMDRCRQSHACFSARSLGFHRPLVTEQSSDSMAAVTVRSDFRAQEEDICHCFHLSPFYLPWSNGAGCHDLSLFVCFF